jgi:hypothetical protein
LSPLVSFSSTEKEGTALLDILSDRHRLKRGAACSLCQGQNYSLRGDIIVNGFPVRPSTMRSRVSYVQRNLDFPRDMTVYQILLFQSFLRSPGSATRRIDTNGRVSIEELSL